MKRRTLLKLLGGIPLVAGVGFRPRGAKVVVVGGGILGTSVAYRLAKRGAEVTLLEKAQLASGASGKSGAWINAYHSKLPQHYFRLSHLSAVAWHELEGEVDGLLVKWGGRVEWQRDAQAGRDLRAAVEQQQRWGYPIELLDSDRLSHVAPSLVVDPELKLAVFASEEGAVEPVTGVRALAVAAASQGAVIEIGHEVLGIEQANGAVVGVRTNNGIIEADTVVVAAGVDTPALAASVGVSVPLQPAPGVLAHGTPTGPNLGPIIVGPDVFIIPQPSGRYVIGRGFRGEPVYSAERPESEHAEAESILALAKQRLHHMDAVTLESVTVGRRPLPVDGHPIIGFPESAPGVYLMVTHSGFTLAPILSQLATSEILDGMSVDMLTPYRVERFG